MSELSTGYPILLNLQDRQVAVVGGGRVATRKVQHLLNSGALVLVISPVVTDELDCLAKIGKIELLKSHYQRDMLNAYMPVLVIAATDNGHVNEIVAQDAHRIRALSNVANGSSESDFSNMALINHPPLTIALSTNGTSPAMLRRLRQQLELVIGAEYAVLTDWMGEIRQPLKNALQSQDERQSLYQQILESEVLKLLRDDKQDQARQLFQQIVAEGTSQ